MVQRSRTDAIPEGGVPGEPSVVAVFPGSFDPLTNGHVDVVARSVKIFDRVIVALLSNAQKSTLFSLEERVEMARKVFAPWGDRVVVDSFSGLLVQYARASAAKVVIRGLRAITDYDYEAQMALMNKSLYEELETVFLVSREKNSYISSSLVKQVAELGGDVSALVPESVLMELKQKFKS